MTLAQLIAQRYPAPEWAVFYEVSNGTGFGASRRADAVALGIWPSRGYTLLGFEFKTDRRDWLRERKDPAKADKIASMVDLFYLVTSHDKIAGVAELPEPWGLLVANEGMTQLREHKPATLMPDVDRTTIRRSFAAAMLRKVPETMVPKADVDRRIEAAVATERQRRSDERTLDYLRKELAEAQGIIERFKQVTGVDLNGWHGSERLIEAVDVVLRMPRAKQNIEHAQRALLAAAADMERAVKAWPNLKPDTVTSTDGSVEPATHGGD